MECKDILLEPCPMREMVHMQRAASKITWRPSPGRHLSFIVTHNSEVIALINLGSPVMNMKQRDIRLGLSSHDMRQKGLDLRHYMDLSVCVGIQPLAWHWNLGKLAAMIAPSLGEFYLAKYRTELKGIITTSVWGRSSQYNRIYEYLGISSGHGSEHVSEDEFRMMRAALKKIGWSTKWKHTRMAVIQDYRKLILGRPHDVKRSTTHGHRRGIYYHAATPYGWQEVVSRWYVRWGLPRWERTKSETAPYSDGLTGARAATEERTQAPIGRLFY